MKRWILRIGLGLAALVVLVVGAAATFVLTFDPAAYKQEIAAAFEAATGRKIELAGKIESDILTLEPAITLHDSVLANPPGFSRPHFATAKRVYLIVKLRPLLDRRLDIVRLEIVGADVLFETNEKGERNWDHKSGARPLAPVPAPVPGIRVGVGQRIAGLSVDQFRLERSRIAYLHGTTKLETAINFEAVRVNIPDVDKPIKVRAEGVYQGTKIHTEGTVGTLDELLRPRPGARFPIALKVTFGRSEFAIDLKADLAARIPTAVGRVTARQIDLDELNPPAARAAAPSDGRLFSATPLPLGILNAFDANGEIDVDLLILRGHRFTGIAAKIALEGGDLAAAPFSFTLAGARVLGDLRVNAASELPAVAVKATGNGIRLHEVTKVLFDVATMSSSMSFTVNVNGRGRSMREIAAGLNGPVFVALGPGPINATTLDFLSKDIFSVHRADQLSLVCAIARFDFARGTGATQRIVIDTTRATAYGRGWVNLGSETLDITFAPTTKGKSLASVAAIVPVRVHGPLRRPNATQDLSRAPEEVMKSIVGVVELPGEIFSSIFGTPSGRPTRAGCGTAAGTAPATPPAKKDDGIVKRGTDVLKRINPF